MMSLTTVSASQIWGAVCTVMDVTRCVALLKNKADVKTGQMIVFGFLEPYLQQQVPVRKRYGEEGVVIYCVILIVGFGIMSHLSLFLFLFVSYRPSCLDVIKY
jgi:hypothetical protein